MTWLPRPTYQEKRDVVLSRPFLTSSLRFSEFLAPNNILFFSHGESKLQIIEALVTSFPTMNSEKVLKDLWWREREGSLTVSPDISIVRARVDSLLHVQAALGLCPNGFPDPFNPGGETRVVILLMGPAERLRIHLRFLTEISALFRDKALVKTILRLYSPREVIGVLQEAESIARGSLGFWRRIKWFFAGLLSTGALS